MMTITPVREEQSELDLTPSESLSPASPTSLLPSPDATLSLPTAGRSRVRHHLIPARPSTCIRAPCLKRNSSSPTPESTLAAHVSIGAPALTTALCLFAAPRCASYAGPRRQVHFDESEPEQFPVHSGQNYDRRPIECTQGGSEFDMSLPPRCTSHSLSDDDATEDSEPGEQTSQNVGPFQDSSLEGWSCLKNGTVIAPLGYQPSQQTGLTMCGKSMHSSLWNSMQATPQASGTKSLSSIATADEGNAQVKKNEVSLPVHGFRSFGGLSNTFSSKPSLLDQSSPERTPSALKLASPDATPMPSPSIYKTLASDGSMGYFGRSEGLSSRTVEGSVHECGQTLPSVPATNTALSLSEPLASEERLRSLGSRTILALNESAASLTLKRNEVAQSPQATQEATSIRAAEMATPPAGSGWPSALGLLSSPLSSRCSSVDPWSNHSSDVDGDGTDSPSNETSWISSSCTSPDLAPADRGCDSSALGKVSPSSSLSWLDGNDRPAAHSDIDDGRADHQQTDAGSTTGNADLPDESRFSSSVETVSAIHLAQKKGSDFYSGVIADDVWMSENSISDVSRRPSLQHYELEAFQLAPRMKTRKVQHAAAAATVGEGSMLKARTRSSSRDGTAPNKSKSSKCKACRLVREREKAMVAANTALASNHCASPELGGGAAVEAASPTLSLMSMEEEPHSSPTKQHLEFPSRTRSRSASKNCSLSSSRTRERSGERTCRPLSPSSSSWIDSPSVSVAGEQPSPSPRLTGDSLPLDCTCDKKKEKDALRRKMRKERELEKERDREWERDQARGRQRRLFGDSFDGGDSSCLSALDGF